MTRDGCRGLAVAGLAVLGVLAAGCVPVVAAPGAPPTTPAPTTPTTPSPATPSPAGPTPGPDLLVGSGTVLDSGSGPEFCLGGVAESYPPQCGGPPIDGWVWPQQGTERANGVTWGSFALVGTYDGRRFRLVEQITEEQAARSRPPTADPDLATPCAEPAGGWRPVDPDRAGSEDQQRAVQLAERLPGYAELWLDDRGDPNQDPATTVINVQVTGSVEEAERRLRTVWGGPLCVTTAPHAKEELLRIQQQLGDEPDLLSSGSWQGVLTVVVVHDDGSLQRRYDRRFGDGVVRVTSALQPYRG